MKLWPDDQFEIETSLSIDEIVAGLNPMVKRPKFFRIWNRGPYQGVLSRDGF